MASSTVRINSDAQQLLRDLSREEGRSMQAVLEQALEEYRKKRFFEAVNKGYEKLRNNPAAWDEEMAERRAWDVTLADGLEED